MKPSTSYQGSVNVNGKRRNVTLSCAECRRLKLKCSRVFPCANCVKKGCEAIWLTSHFLHLESPDGSLTTGKGNRFVLANTEFLHEKINSLSTRVRQLEDALENTHSKLSTEPHPLLTDELRALKKPLEKGNEMEQPVSKAATSTGTTDTLTAHDPDPVDTHEVIDLVGSLSMNRPGRDNYHGSSANAFYLLRNEDDEEVDEEDEDLVDDTLPDCVPWLSHSFPFAPNITNVARSIREEILNCLPEPAEARELSNFYFQNAAWMYTPISEEEYNQDIFALFYDHNMSAAQDPLESHKLGLLFLVFAMGKLMDIRGREILIQEATRYYQIGRAALTINSVLESRSIPALQALIVMCHFMFLANVENSRWVVMGMAVKMAQSIGLHRDGAKFNLPADEIQKRRSLMWEIYTYDSWQSLTFGRPVSFSLSTIDCEMAHGTTQSENGELEMSFSAWKHRFVSQCLSIVHDQAFGARPPNYKVIQELDKKVRGFYIPPSLQVPGFSGKASASSSIEMERPTLQLTMQRYITWAIKEISIFYMHRGYFARSLEDNKDDPLGGKYGSSVLAAHGSACSFINLIKSLHLQHPGMAERMWFLFTHVFSCSIVLGSIATKCPGIPLSRSAFSNLDSAYLLFESVSYHPRAAKVLPVLKRLRERALASISDHQSKRSLLPRLSVENSHVKAEEDELLTLGGKTRLVPRKSTSTPSSRAGSDSLSATSPPTYIRGDTNSPQQFIESPETVPGLSGANSAVDSPMSEWQSNWGPLSSSPGYPYSSFQQLANSQYVDHSPTAGPSHSPQYPRASDPRIQQQQQQQQPQWMMNMDPPAPPSMEHNMFGTSSLGTAMSQYGYPGQQQMMSAYAPQAAYPNPPPNDFHRDWQLFLEQTMES